MRRVIPYALAFTCMLAVTALSFWVQPFAKLEDLTMIHLLGIVLIAMRASVRVSMSAAIGGILAFDYFFIPPAFAFAWADAKNSLTFALMLIVAGVISGLNQRLRDQEQLARDLAFRAETLYALKVDLARGTDPEQLAAATIRHLERLFAARVVILLGAPPSGVNGLSEAEIELAHRCQVRWVPRPVLPPRSRAEDRTASTGRFCCPPYRPLRLAAQSRLRQPAARPAIGRKPGLAEWARSPSERPPA